MEISKNVNSGNVTFNLVPFNGEQQNGVDARELHEQLKVKTQFKDWIKRRLAEAQLLENQDFVCCSNLSGKTQSGGFPKNGGKPQGGHNRMEYALSIDAAKHIAMMERNDAGRRVRQYFIDFENKTKQLASAMQKEVSNVVMAVMSEAIKPLYDRLDRIESTLKKMAIDLDNTAIAAINARMEAFDIKDQLNAIGESQKLLPHDTSSFKNQPITTWLNIEQVAVALCGPVNDVWRLAGAARLLHDGGSLTHKAISKDLVRKTGEGDFLFSPKAVRLMRRAHNG